MGGDCRDEVWDLSRWKGVAGGFGLGGPAEGGEVIEGALPAWDPQPFAGDLVAIAGEAGGFKECAGEVVADPGARGPLGGAWSAHPAREVLEMADRIPEKPA